MEDDAALVARVLLDDDRRAFSCLVDRHQARVRSLLTRMCRGDSATADDLAQETFLRAYRGLRAFRGGSRFTTWLYRISYNVFIDFRRKLPPPVAPSEPPSSLGNMLDARKDLEWAMAQISPSERLAVTLTYAEGYTHEEIAAIIGCPLGTAKTHVLRGRAKLSALLRPEADESLEAKP